MIPFVAKREREKFCLSLFIFLHRCLRSVASVFLVMRKGREIEIEREREKKKRIYICRCLFVAIVSAATKQTQIMVCVAVRIDVSSVTLCVFSSLALATSVRRLFCCYDHHAMYTHRLSFFFRFSRRCRRRRLTTHTYNTLFPFASTSSFLFFSLFFFSLAI